MSLAELGIEIPRNASGNVRTVCPKCSSGRHKSKEKCLSVNVDEGTWFCHHTECGWSGGIKQKKEYRPVTTRKVYTKPTPPKTDLPLEVVKFFEARGIPEKVLRRNKIGAEKTFMPGLGKEVLAITFPYFEKGEVVNIKYRSLDGKSFKQVSDAKKIFYGLDDIDGDEVLIVEGEPDKLAFEVAGYKNVLSVPDGAPPANAKSYETKFDFLGESQELISRLKKIIIAVDNDGPGKKLEDELIRRLGPERCWRVEWPEGCKDANDVLVKEGDFALAVYVEKARPVPVAGLFEIKDIEKDIDELYENGMQGGVSTGWWNVSQYYTVRPGEWTLVSGIPSHGKSSMVDALLVNLSLNHDWRFAIFSPENQPLQRHAAKIASLYVGKSFGSGGSQMDSKEKDEAKAWMQDRFFFVLPPEDELTIDHILAKAKVAVARYGIRGLVIDPWNEIDHSRPSGLSETEYISKSLTLIRRFARVHQVHVWVIAHPTKLQKDANGNYPVPTPYDVSGCHDDKTEVLTERGWIPHREVTLGDKVCCYSMENETLSYQHPTKLWAFDVDGELVRLSSPSFDALVTKNHRIVVRAGWKSKPSFKQRYRGSGLGRPQKYDEKWRFIEAGDIKSDLLMPWATPLTDSGNEHPISDDKLRFIGWWIAEGHNSNGSLSICQAVGDVSSRMRECLVRMGMKFSERVTHYKQHELPMWQARLLTRWDVRANTFSKMVMHECGVGAENKRLPSFTWKLSARQKGVLLDAYLEGDGHIPKNRKGVASATTVSARLADDLQRLSIELGHMASVSFQGRAEAHHKDRYQINIGRADRRTMTLRRGRNVTYEKYKGKVYCLTVPTGAYLVRRNGKPGIYGNSSHWRNKADCCIAVWRDLMNEKKRVQIHIQKVRFREVGKPGIAELEFDYTTGRYSDPEGLGF